MSSFSQDKGGQVDAISKEMVPKFGGTTKLICHALNGIDPLQGAAFSKGFIAKLHAARRCDAVEQPAPSECVVRCSYHRSWHSNNPQLSTTLPCLCPHHPNSCSYADVTQTRHRCESALRTISSGFMGTWTARGMSWNGHPSKVSFEGRTSLQLRNTMVHSVLCCSFSQIGFSK